MTMMVNPRWWQAGSALGLVAVIALVLISVRGAEPAAMDAASPAIASDGPEAGFARDMQVHHAQAVEMALIVRDRTDDPVLRSIAYDIATAQQQQIGQLYAWLELWQVPQTGTMQPMAWMAPSGDMAGMDHDTMHGTPTPGGAESSMLLADGRMPGMASDAEMLQLERLTGAPAEQLFLRLMIRHHQAGIVMARAVLEQSQVPQVQRFANNVVTSQTAEIAQMEQLLE